MKFLLDLIFRYFDYYGFAIHTYSLLTVYQYLFQFLLTYTLQFPILACREMRIEVPSEFAHFTDGGGVSAEWLEQSDQLVPGQLKGGSTRGRRLPGRMGGIAIEVVWAVRRRWGLRGVNRSRRGQLRRVRDVREQDLQRCAHSVHLNLENEQFCRREFQ